MANGVNGIGSNSTPIGGGYQPPTKKNNNDHKDENINNSNQNTNRVEVDPKTIYKWLANNATMVNFIKPATQVDGTTKVDDLEKDVEERITDFIKNYYEPVAQIIEQDFGAKYVPAIMDIVMPRLLGLKQD